MKITVEFANLDEFKQYMGIESPSALARANRSAEVAEVTPAPAGAEAVQEAAQEPQEAPEAPKPKNNTKKTQKAAPAEAEAAPEPDPASAEDDSAPEVTEEFRITVRKQLAALNKKCGRNRAAELISELTGKSKLTEVDLADLPKLMEAAKEETNAD